MSIEIRHLRKNGRWVIHEDNCIKWREDYGKAGKKIIEGNEPKTVQYEYFNPDQCGYAKEITFPILLVRERPSQLEFDGIERYYFVQIIHIAVREDKKDVWLSREYHCFSYLHDLRNQRCFEAPLNSTVDLIVEKEKPVRIKSEDLKKVINEVFPFIFTRIQEGSEGTEYGIQAVKKGSG